MIFSVIIKCVLQIVINRLEGDFDMQYWNIIIFEIGKFVEYKW